MLQGFEWQSKTVPTCPVLEWFGQNGGQNQKVHTFGSSPSYNV